MGAPARLRRAARPFSRQIDASLVIADGGGRHDDRAACESVFVSQPPAGRRRSPPNSRPSAVIGRLLCPPIDPFELALRAAA
jgi:hypothetical protein